MMLKNIKCKYLGNINLLHLNNLNYQHNAKIEIFIFFSVKNVRPRFLSVHIESFGNNKK